MPKLMIRLFTFMVLTIFFLAIFACSLLSPCSQSEVERVKSPDNKVEAVLVKNDCGATTSETYNVYVVSIGEKIVKNKSVFNADHVDNLSLFWRKAKYLEIKYNQARIFHFENFWQSKKVENFSYVVEIRESPPLEAHALSASDRWENK